MRLKPAGFTLVELIVTLAVLAVLAALAIPTFSDFRQRASLRGSADQLTAFWGDARFEALKRNAMVKVGFQTTSTGAVCIGAATTTDPADNTACDCFSPVANSSGRCNVSRFPASQDEWRGIRIPSLPTLGDTDTDTDGVAVIDPKRGVLTDRGDAGRMSLRSPEGSMDYRLDVFVDGNGRVFQCEPAAAPSKIPDFGDRQC